MKKYTLGDTTAKVEERIASMNGRDNLSPKEKKDLNLYEEMLKLQRERNKLMKEIRKIKPKKGDYTKKVNLTSKRAERWELTSKIKKIKIKLGSAKKGDDKYSTNLAKKSTKDLKKLSEGAKKMKDLVKAKKKLDGTKKKKTKKKKS